MTTTQTPPGPRGLPVVGNTHQWMRDPCAFKERCADRYGRVVNYEIIGMDAYMLTNPEDIERVLVGTGEGFRKHQSSNEQLSEFLGKGLVTSEGELWERQREAIQPAFFMDQISDYVDSMVGRASDATDRWDDGQRIDVQDEMMRTTLEILVESMFGEDVDLAERGIYDAVDAIHGPLKPENQPITFLAPDWAPIPFLRRFDRAIDHLDEQIYDIVARRRASDAEREDLLAMLLSAEAEMSDEQIRDEMLTFILAGHETTALTLTYVFDLLTRHPDAADALRSELDDVLDSRPTFEDVFELEYTERIVEEAMRLYPPAHEIRRESVTDVTFGEYRVPAGSLIVLPTWVLHRDDRYWDAPEQFRPERWSEDADRPEFAYFPFGGGPRRCIGQQFAMLEAQLVLATIASEWTVDREYDGLELSAAVTLQPKNDVEMTVRRR